MKIQKMYSPGRICRSFFAVAALSVATFTIQSNAQIYNLHQNNSSVDINLATGPGGMSNWLVDGVNQLNQSWLYYRIGSTGPEFPIENLNATPSINSYVNVPGLSRLDLTYANAANSVRTLYVLTGNTSGSGKSIINETITVANGSAASEVFHLFQYSDFNLGGVAGGQSAQFYANGINGQLYKVIQSSGGASVTETITTADPAVGHVEANLSPLTLASLTDGNPTTLDDVTSIGPGDATFAYEWDVTLAPGASFQISKILSIVPEPSSLSFAGSAVLAWVLARRRRS